VNLHITHKTKKLPPNSLSGTRFCWTQRIGGLWLSK